jgi:hypothetical protein
VLASDEPGQRQRLRQLAPGTWDQALADALAVSRSRQNTSVARRTLPLASSL